MLVLRLSFLSAALLIGVSAEPYDRDIVFEGAIGQVRAAWQLSEHYKSLGEALGDKKKTIEDEADIYEVVAEVRSKMEKWDSSPIWSKLLTQKPPENAIKLFASLPSGIVQCNFQGYLNLASNYAAAIGNDRRLSPTDQIRSSVVAAIESHGLICGQEYSKSFKAKYEEIDPGLLDRLKQVLNNDLLDIVFPKDLREALRKTDLLGDFRSRWSKNLLDRLVTASSPSERKSNFETGVVNKYLISPCRQLVFELNDVFEPAKLDMALDDSFIKQVNPDHSVLMRDAWKRYLICNMINLNAAQVGRELIDRQQN